MKTSTYVMLTAVLFCAAAFWFFGCWTPLSEASGLAASRSHHGIFWTHNDSGGGSEVFGIDRARNIICRSSRHQRRITIGKPSLLTVMVIYISLILAITKIGGEIWRSIGYRNHGIAFQEPVRPSPSRQVPCCFGTKTAIFFPIERDSISMLKRSSFFNPTEPKSGTLYFDEASKRY